MYLLVFELLDINSYYVNNTATLLYGNLQVETMFAGYYL
jgi:hypothetical protein